MRFAIPVLLITVLAAGPAMADRDHGGGGNGGGGGGGGGGKFKFAYLTVTNLHDDAVLVSASGAGGFGERSLEPNSSHTFVFMLSGGKTSDVIVTASLVSDSSVSTSHACTLQGNRTTSATVTSTVTAGAVSLAIECGDPSRVAAALTRNSAVMLASGSGLGFLLLVGMLLGHAPVSLRQKPVTGARGEAVQ